MRRLPEIFIDTESKRPALQLDWENDRHHRVELKGPAPENIALALNYLADLIRFDISNGYLPAATPGGERVVKKGMNFWVKNDSDIFNDYGNPDVEGMEMRHVRVVDIEHGDTIICRPAHGPNQGDDFVFGIDELIKMENKYSV